MLEKKHEPYISRRHFVRRLSFFFGIAGLLILTALAIGVAGYHWIAGFDFVDALLNASMILTGMGPVGELKTTSAKLFASVYALFSGLVFITTVGMLFTPVVHRILHKFHFDEREKHKLN
jgi:hypothetical protein